MGQMEGCPQVLEAIARRRSIRRYTAKAVRKEDILVLLKAAMSAPSASNRKPWEFVVVTEAPILDRLRRGLVFGHHNAPMAIVVCGNRRRALPAFAGDFWIQDCSAAIENMLLAATGLGLGTVWIGVHPLRPLVRYVSGVLALPRHVIPLGVVYVGHPAETKEPRTQYDESKVHWQVYGS